MTATPITLEVGKTYVDRLGNKHTITLPDTSHVDLAMLEALLPGAKVREDTIASGELVKAARERHCDGSNNEIEIDEPAGASHGDDGAWVQAWVFVPGRNEDDAA